jgi:group I intron endonuclease
MLSTFWNLKAMDLNILPDTFEDDLKINKQTIYKLLRRKAGVYVFINKVNNKRYIGSSINLTKRMTSYYYYTSSSNKSTVPIIRAMKKYGLNAFSLGIKEFCIESPINCIILEQKWIDFYKPEYNVLAIAGSSSGFKHSAETIDLLKKKFSKENHPLFGTKRSTLTVNSIKKGINDFYINSSHPSKGLKRKLSPLYGIGDIAVYLYNKEGEFLTFPSLNAARQHFKVRWSLIKNNIDTKTWTKIHDSYWMILSSPKE